MAETTFLVEHRYLNLPVQNGTEKRVARFADGLVALPVGVISPDDDLTLRLCVKGGQAIARTLTVHELAAVWRR